jgi:hypothetical protein
LFGGKDSNLNTDIGATGQLAGWATGQGEKNLTTGSNFMNSIVSGDSSKINQALAPEISAAKKSASQTTKGNTIFGTRSGGTAASNAATTDKLHSDITNLIGSLTGNAASTLMSAGSNELSQGAAAYSQNADLSAQRMKNWSDSILGRGITTGVAAAESYALGGMSGGGGGGGGGEV